jgi:hypothetical protein
MSAWEATGKMPYDFSPARLRCIQLAGELAAASWETERAVTGVPGNRPSNG